MRTTTLQDDCQQSTPVMREQRTGQCYELQNPSLLDLPRAALQTSQVQGSFRAPHPALVHFKNRSKKHLWIL
ncbi:MAG: hypothetical protein CMJ70_03520 [Planctomycetaceae bacterium]|nr:hypothetical protein [Planctomycetaceae bacterium]